MNRLRFLIRVSRGSVAKNSEVDEIGVLGEFGRHGLDRGPGVQGEFGGEVLGHGHARDDADVEQAFLEEDVPHLIIGPRPLEAQADAHGRVRGAGRA